MMARNNDAGGEGHFFPFHRLNMCAPSYARPLAFGENELVADRVIIFFS